MRIHSLKDLNSWSEALRIDSLQAKSKSEWGVAFVGLCLVSLDGLKGAKVMRLPSLENE